MDLSHHTHRPHAHRLTVLILCLIAATLGAGALSGRDAAIVQAAGQSGASAGSAGTNAQAGPSRTLTGRLAAAFGPHGDVFWLVDDADPTQYTTVLLDPDVQQQNGNVARLQGQRVTVAGTLLASAQAQPSGPAQPAVVRAQTLTLASATRSGGTIPAAPVQTGTKPYINLPCQFSDVSGGMQPISYFQAMMNAVPNGMNDYFIANSYGRLNINGSGVASQWRLLPHPQTYYLGLNQSAFWQTLFQDCTGVHDAEINFATYSGVNLVFNGALNGCAWGGSSGGTLDGQNKVWPTTWMTSACQTQSAFAHEMGHSLGLGHTTTAASMAAATPSEYDNVWSPMGSPYSSANATFTWEAQHYQTYEKDDLGWLASGQEFIYSSGTQAITLMPPGGTGTDLVMAKIPISATHFYTVEARKQAGYDAGLPANGVIIHDVDLTRNSCPSIDLSTIYTYSCVASYVVDRTPDTVTSTNSGQVWSTGQVYHVPGANVAVTIGVRNVDGSFAVTLAPDVAVPSLIFSTQPAGASAGVAFTTQPVVTAKASDGTVLTSFSGPVTLAIASGTGASGALLSGTKTVNASAGVATFSGLAINLSGSSYQLTAGATLSGTAAAVNSAAFDVQGASAVTVDSVWASDAGSNWNLQKTSFFPGDSIGYTGTITNSSGASVTAVATWEAHTAAAQISYYSGSLSFAPGSGIWRTTNTVPACTAGALPGLSAPSVTTAPPETRSASGQVRTAGAASSAPPAASTTATQASAPESLGPCTATFTLTVVYAGVTSSKSMTFTIQATPTATVTTVPAGATAGQTFTAQPVVTVRDAGGSTVTAYTGAITLALKSGSGTAGATLSGTKTVNAVAGVASFSGLAIDQAGTGYVLTASGTNLASTDSAAFTVSAPAALAPVISSPANGATLTAASQAFSWGALAGITEYWVYAGSSVGGYQYYSNTTGTTASVALSGLPTNGSTIYLRLWSHYPSGQWLYNDYTYTAFTAAATTATISSPANHATLTGASQAFTWAAIGGVTEYWLYAGSSAGAYNYYSNTAGLATTFTIPGLPTDGSTLYVRLWTHTGTTWTYTDSSYTAATIVQAPTKATISSPANNATLTGTSQAFTWSSIAGVTEYWLYAGSSLGAYNYYSNSTGLATTFTITRLPGDGSTVYVRLWTHTGSTWLYNDYTYTAYTAPPTTAAMITPANGATLTGSSQAFTWSAIAGVTQYWLYAGSTLGAYNYYSNTPGTATGVTINNLPVNSSTVYIRLWTNTGTTWLYNDYSYTAAAH